ncbi:MAG: hypothetical protein COV67_09000 [Nitrospinae bacterium CG11_big_fil_rev_8_21_14_0_20_56_8]|nr:MAG: hypothetical protein COV67_09000 [Nitrospinae bacterium CG11_big_fil_rev_8_21_14_0_20_56_8]
MKNKMDAVNSLVPAVYSTNQAENGTGVDLRDFDAAVVLFMTGVITDGTFTPKIQESDDDVTYTDVDPTDQEGALSALSASAVQRLGYKGSKRYLRPVVTVASATSGGAVAAHVIRALPHRAPVA